MFKLIKDKIQGKIKRHELMTMKVNIAYFDGMVVHKYKNISVVKENGVSHLCYDYVTENTEEALGLALGTALNNLALGYSLTDNSELAYCDLLSGERVYPDKGSKVKYLGAIMPITQDDVNNKSITIQASDIQTMLDNYDCEQKYGKSMSL